MAAGDKVDPPHSLKVVGLSTGTLTPEWRETFDKLITLVNELSTEVQILKENQNG